MDEPTEYVYTGEDSRTYEVRALHVERGDIVEWPSQPDHRWSEQGTEEADAAIAEKQAREIAEAATEAAAEPVENIRPDVPAGTLPEDNVGDINDYLTGLKDGTDPDLYESERQRLISEQTRKGLAKGPHAEPASPIDPDGADPINTEV